MYLLWSHGLDAVPWGSKSTALAEAAKDMGFTLDALDYNPERDPDKRVDMALAHLSGKSGPVALAGSSLGGYVSAAVSLRMPVAGLFLTAPAFYLPGFGTADFTNFSTPCTAIVHGWNDEVVPPENSWRFARTRKADLHMLDADHRLAGAEARLAALFREWLGLVSLAGR